MTFNALDLPVKETWQFAKFLRVADDFCVGAYTDRDSDTEFEGQVYTSETSMEIQLPENNGLLNESPCNIVLPLLAGFPTDLTSGAPYPQTRVEVVEFIRGEGASSVALRTFKGLIAAARRNLAGRRNFIGISALPVKARLQTITLGEPCNHQCINRLGDGRCQVILSVPPNKHNVTISAIDGTEVTVSDSITAGLEDRFYQRGYMLKDGLEIGVQDWRNEVEGDKQVFFMNRRPPSSWIGAIVTLFAGCDKTIETCRDRFGNEEHFNGRGYSMPAYHPNFEDGGARQ
jgi:uncharacterized phage protein (TIGR02218 family)